jgi:hypothetical protein
MKALLLTSWIFTANIICLQAQTAEEINQWNVAIKTKALPEIAQLIEHPSAASWPKLISDASQNLKASGSFKPSDFGNALLEKIRAYEKSVSRQETDSEKAVAIYGSLSRGLQNSGGYINFCLADTVNRLALARLSELLINYPSLVNEVKTAFANLTSVRFSTPQFVQMIGDEPAQKLKTGVNLTLLEDKDARQQILHALGMTMGDVYRKFATNQAGTSNLINNPDIGVLLLRMGETDIIAQVDVAALIDFVEHGGEYSDIRLDDVRPFRTTMNGREGLYKSEMMHINQTNVGYLSDFMKQLKKDDANNMFVVLALQ